MPLYNVSCPGCGDTPMTSDYRTATSPEHAQELHRASKRHQEFDAAVKAYSQGKEDK
jgi:hypothetical protein